MIGQVPVNLKIMTYSDKELFKKILNVYSSNMSKYLREKVDGINNNIIIICS